MLDLATTANLACIPPEIVEDAAPVPPVESEDDGAEVPGPAKRARGPEREGTKCVIVELPGSRYRLRRADAKGCWMGRRREFRSSRDFDTRPPSYEYTHVCKLCWPDAESEASVEEVSEASLAHSGDEGVELQTAAGAELDATVPEAGSLVPIAQAVEGQLPCFGANQGLRLHPFLGPQDMWPGYGGGGSC